METFPLLIEAGFDIIIAPIHVIQNGVPPENIMIDLTPGPKGDNFPKDYLVDIDNGSTLYQIYNNLMLNGGLKFREGYNLTATNNVIINNSLHPHVWNENSGDIFAHNIVFAA